MLVKCYHVNLTSCFKVNRDNAPFQVLAKKQFLHAYSAVYVGSIKLIEYLKHPSASE